MTKLKTAVEQDTEIGREHGAASAASTTNNSAVDTGSIEVARGTHPVYQSPLIRALDIALSLAGMALSGPVILLVALAVKLDSRGSIFFVQERLGLHKRSFGLIKFRTMSVSAEPDGPVWAGDNDPRITRAGRILRKTRLDELPQLYNILKGDMCFVGPRPERAYFAEKLLRVDGRYDARFLVKPGLTGWAQIYWTHSSSDEQQIKKLTYDLRYVDGITLGDYLKILLLTPFAVMKCNGV